MFLIKQIWQRYNDWMNEAIKEYTPSEKIKRPSYSLVINWIKESQDAIDPNMINHSFKCCGVSNAINGMKDGLIFDFNKVEDIINQKRGIEEDEEQNDSENESDDDGNENELENDNNENENDYYKSNKDCNVIQNWNV